MRILADLGDYFCIPLPDGRFSFAQYVFFHPLYATLVRVTSLITLEEMPFESVLGASDLFPPVFVGFNVPVRQRLWKIIGNAPVTNFRFPLFRCRQGLDRAPGKYRDWLLWDGNEYRDLGELPVEYQELEYLVGWSSDALEKRIATGNNEPYSLMS